MQSIGRSNQSVQSGIPRINDIQTKGLPGQIQGQEISQETPRPAKCNKPTLLGEASSQAAVRTSSDATLSRRKRRSQKNHAKMVSRLLTPAWPRCFVSMWALELHVSKIGWDFNLRLRNLVPGHAPVFFYAMVGDICALRTLFESKLASPFDISGDNGKTPLHVRITAVLDFRRANTEEIRSHLHTGTQKQSDSS